MSAHSSAIDQIDAQQLGVRSRGVVIREIAKEKIALVQREIDGFGFVTRAESFNALDAWLSTLPGHNYRNVRRPIVSSLNLTHTLPLSAVWSGERWNAHLQAPALLVGETEGATPFYLNLHTGNVSHTMMIAPTGAGKSTLLTRRLCVGATHPHRSDLVGPKSGDQKSPPGLHAGRSLWRTAGCIRHDME